jgi:iron-sulfur cluster repair protein YtfE (RIC family)
VFDPGLGQVRAGFFFSRYGFDFCAIGERSLEAAQKQTARENPRRIGRTYSP